MKITIEKLPEYGWNVQMDGKYAKELCWDEMLGVVAKLTLGLEPQYPMRTEEEWRKHDAKLREMIEKRAEELPPNPDIEKLKQYETKTWPPFGTPYQHKPGNEIPCMFDGLDTDKSYGISCPCPRCSPTCV